MANKIRYDVNYAIDFNSRRTEKSLNGDITNAKRTFRCSSRTKKKVYITYIFMVSCAANYRGDPETGKGTSEYVIKFCGRP